MTQNHSAFPFEPQETGWMCGAASLCMVYRSLGLSCTQREVWASIAPADPRDRTGVEMSRLGHDALARGLSALVFQASRPWEVLNACEREGARVILNQPLTQGSRRRHFSVLVQVETDQVILYDPLFGPSQRLPKAELLNLWGSTCGNYKAIPNSLVVITGGEPAPARCPTCETLVPDAVDCPTCRESVPLHPTLILGCADPACPETLWKRIYCPHCNASFSLLAGDQPGATRSQTDGEDNMAPIDIHKITSAVEQYQSKLAAAQAEVDDPSLRDQLQFLQTQLKATTEELTSSTKTFQKSMQESLRRSEERAAAAERKRAEALQARAEALQRLEAKRAAKAQAALVKPARKSIDPHLGEKLRDRLLEEFGTRREQPAPGPADYGSLMDYDPGS